jgi:hypothetical protein
VQNPWRRGSASPLSEKSPWVSTRIHVYECVIVFSRQKINCPKELCFSAAFSLNHFTIRHFTSLTIASSLSPHITPLLFSLFARTWREARSSNHKGNSELHQTRLRSMVCTAALCRAISHFSLFSSVLSHFSLFTPHSSLPSYLLSSLSALSHYCLMHTGTHLALIQQAV